MKQGIRRRHDRRAVDVDVRISSIDPEIDPRTGRRYYRETEETCATLSPGGAFLRTREPLTPGNRVVLAIHVPGEGEPIEATARVAWVKHPIDANDRSAAIDAGAGVEFTDADPAARRAIVRYLDRNPAGPGRQEPARGIGGRARLGLSGSLASE